MKTEVNSPTTRFVLLAALAAGACHVAPSAESDYPSGHMSFAVSPAAGAPEGVRPVEAPPRELEAQAAPSSTDEWTFTPSAYFWLVGRSGSMKSGKIAIPLDDPDEGTGGFLYFEGERGRWGFAADLESLTGKDRTNTTLGKIKVDEDTIIGEVDATYRPGGQSTLQLLAGLRVLDDSVDIHVSGTPTTSADATQVDPVIGAQGTWPLDERFAFRLRGDIGGFGLDSDFTYQLLGLVGWEFASSWQVTAGYRILGWEFEEDGVDSDVRMSGALLGVAVSF